MAHINWDKPLQTDCGVKLKTIRANLVSGIPADPASGRNLGEDAEWHYTDSGFSCVPFLPNIRNVKDAN